MRKKRFMLAVILLLGIGFAAVSTTLILTGNVTIATNDADFDVKFTKAVIDGTDTPSAIIEGGKKITFGTKDLVTVGDKSVLDFEVTNNSEMYDAKVSVACSATGDKSSYYEITSSGEMEIAGKTKGTGKVEVKLLKASVTDESVPFTCTLTATAKERTTKAKEKYIPKYFAFEEGNGLDIPTTASTQDYTTLKYPDIDRPARIFLGLDADGVQKSVCTLATGSLECLKNNNWEEEKTHIIEIFGEANCNVYSYYVSCNSSYFINCGVFSDGMVECTSSDGAKINVHLSADDSAYADVS